MTWVSMFAVGACVVDVYTKNSATPAWSGALSLGQASPEFADDGGTIWMVSVSDVGDVTLQMDSNAETSQFGARVAILPQYDVSTQQTQVSAISSKYSGSYGGGGASCDGSGVTGLTFDSSTGDASPPIVTFPAHQPSPESFVQVAANGGF